MKELGRLIAHYKILAFAVVVLIAGHGIAYNIFRHRAIPVSLFSGGILLVLITHLGIGR